MEKPKVRPLEAVPVAVRGQQMILLRDPQGFSERVLSVSQPVFYLVTQFDGTRTVTEIQADFTRRFGQLILSDKIREVIAALDNALLLDNERFRQHRRELEETFRRLSVRPSSHAGRSYPASPEELTALLDGFFDPPEGPGQPVPGSMTTRPAKAIMAPHLDLRRGGACFAHAYKALAESPPADTCLILGIAHTPTQYPYVFTAKSFETPLGVCRCDSQLTNALLARAGTHLLTDEWVHRNEHSIEFQVLFVQRLFPRAQIVSILCGGLYDDRGHPVPPPEVPGVPEFIAALRETLAETGKRVCVIASVDFSHVGHRFGDQLQLTPQVLRRVEQDDRETLQRILDLDADAFFASATADNDRRHIDATPAVYALLRALDLEEAELLKYDQSVEPQTQSVVSFASMVFR